MEDNRSFWQDPTSLTQTQLFHPVSSRTQPKSFFRNFPLTEQKEAAILKPIVIEWLKNMETVPVQSSNDKPNEYIYEMF